MYQWAALLIEFYGNATSSLILPSSNRAVITQQTGDPVQKILKDEGSANGNELNDGIYTGEFVPTGKGRATLKYYVEKNANSTKK